MYRQQISDDDIVGMLDECDVSDPDDVLSEFDEEFIPQGDTSEEEDNLEVNSEGSDVASENSDRFRWR